MGLDTTHNAWHGPYSSFNDWRTWIASKAGITLSEMEGFGDRDYSNPNRKFGTIKWNTIKDDLKHLLNHSDCEGHIAPTRCKKIADRLTTLMEGQNIPASFNDAFLEKDGYMWYKTKQFRDGCLEAFKLKEKLEFH